MRHTQNGFTLVELAISLMIIGLLIGGVLKGQELIENARITRAAKNITDYDAAVMIFRNTYGGLPGDIRRPSRIPGCDGFPCSYVDSTVGQGHLTTGITQLVFWAHLDAAKLISGGMNYSNSVYCASPLNPFDSYDTVAYTDQATAAPLRLQAGNTFSIMAANNPIDGPPCSSNFPPVKRAAAIDQKIDDGRPFTGTVRVPLSTDAATQCHDDTTEEYVTDTPTDGCQLFIYTGSIN